MKTIIIDVRTEKEFLEGAYPGAINMPSEKFDASDYSPYKDQHIALVCFSGARAANVKLRLEAQGFQHVSLLEHQMVHIQEGPKQTTDTWTVDRQFRLALGLILGTAIMAQYVLMSSLSLYILLIVFSGLIYSAITDNCYLKVLITLLPWNRSLQVTPKEYSSSLERV